MKKKFLSMVLATGLALSGVFAGAPSVYADTMVSKHSVEFGEEVEVNIPDKALKSAIEEELGLSPGSKITAEDMGRLTSLIADDKGVQSIEGMQYAVNLNSLSLRNNKISDISQLPDAPAMLQLDLSNNKISDISPLAKYHNTLYYIQLANNEISDISAFTEYKSILSLNLGNNEISDISPLAGIHASQDLFLQGNKISDVAPLSSVRAFTLVLDNNKISNLEPIRGLIVSELSLAKNQISDVSALARSSIGELVWLNLNNNQISDVTPLSDHESFWDLVLSNNHISDISSLSNIVFLNDVGPNASNQTKLLDSVPLGQETKISIKGRNGVVPTLNFITDGVYKNEQLLWKNVGTNTLKFDTNSSKWHLSGTIMQTVTEVK